MSTLEALATAGFVLLCVVAVVASVGARRRRAKRLRAYAEERGLDFTDRADDLVDEMRGRARVFDVGHPKSILNVVDFTERDASLRILDFTYIVPRGKSSARHEQTIGVARIEHAPPPSFEIRPRGPLSRFTDPLGRPEIDFAAGCPFAERSIVRGEAAESIREFFDVDTQSRFLDAAEELVVECNGGRVFVYRYSKLVKPADLDRFVERIETVASLLRERAAAMR